jgi:hypothetical protein
MFLLAGVAAPASASELSDKEMSVARKTYVVKCAKCHKFYDPRNYGQAEWGKWMDAMSRKSKLNSGQDAVLRKYLEEYRAGRIAKVPH